MSDNFTARKATAAAWFENLRDQIVQSFETLEDSQTSGPTGRAF